MTNDSLPVGIRFRRSTWIQHPPTPTAPYPPLAHTKPTLPLPPLILYSGRSNIYHRMGHQHHKGDADVATFKELFVEMKELGPLGRISQVRPL